MKREEYRVLETVIRAREQLERIEECIEQLEPEEQEVLEILLEGGETNLRLMEELDVSRATAFRVKARVLARLEELFRTFQVRLS
jgi:FixJ family two-component response regulator